jgi:hypothetical protein
MCIVYRKPQIARYLIKAGCKQNVKDQEGLTPKELGVLGGIPPKVLHDYFGK